MGVRYPLLASFALLACSSSAASTTGAGGASASSGVVGATSAASAGATGGASVTSASSSASTSASTTSTTSSGVGGANLGCAMDPSLTPQEQQLINLPADSWLEIQNTHFADFCPAHVPAGAQGYEGCSAVINDWSGGAWDGRHAQMLLFGGGHHGYFGNEVYGFSTKTFTWSVAIEGTAVPSEGDLTEPMADGTPVSRHTYDGLVYLTAENELLAFGGATAPIGNNTSVTWFLDIGKKSWKQGDPAHALGGMTGPLYFMGSAYDEAGHRVFMRNQDGVFVYDIVADTWTRLLDAGYPPLYPDWSNWNYRRGVYDSKRKIFFTLGGKHQDGKPDFFALDATTLMAVYDQWVTTGGDDIAGGDAPGADYDSAADAIVAWSGGAARVLDLTTKQWSTKSAQGAPPAAVMNGTYGRFRYISRYNVFVLVNNADENVFFYKHSAGCGP